MQFNTILLLSALAFIVAAPTGYEKPAYEKPAYEKPSGGYEKPGYDVSSDTSSSSSTSHGHGSYGYAKPHFAAPSFSARWHNRFHRLGHALHHLFSDFVDFFHTRWVYFKSDLERIHWWLHCRHEHFHVWYKWKCDIAANKRRIRNEYERQIYNSLCEMEKQKKTEYDSRVQECQASGEDYTDEQITNYVDAFQEVTSKPYEEPAKPAYEEPAKPAYEAPKPAYEAPKPAYEAPKPAYSAPKSY